MAPLARVEFSRLLVDINVMWLHSCQCHVRKIAGDNFYLTCLNIRNCSDFLSLFPTPMSWDTDMPTTQFQSCRRQWITGWQRNNMKGTQFSQKTFKAEVPPWTRCIFSRTVKWYRERNFCLYLLYFFKFFCNSSLACTLTDINSYSRKSSKS